MLYYCDLSHRIYNSAPGHLIASITIVRGPHMARWSPVVPQGVGLENERGPDSLALGWAIKS